MYSVTITQMWWWFLNTEKCRLGFIKESTPFPYIKCFLHCLKLCVDLYLWIRHDSVTRWIYTGIWISVWTPRLLAVYQCATPNIICAKYQCDEGNWTVEINTFGVKIPTVLPEDGIKAFRSNWEYVLIYVVMGDWHCSEETKGFAEISFGCG